MNIVSMTVTAAIMGIVAPGVAQMSIMPVIAQKRATNFGIAESRAVAYAALNEGAPQLTPIDTLATEGCTVNGDTETNAYVVTCSEGDQFRQTVTRAFKLAPLAGGSSSSGYTAPVSYTPGIFCPLWDAWGVNGYNDAHNVQCLPVAYGPWASTYTGEMLW